METPIEVIGFEKIERENGAAGLRIYGIRDVMSDTGTGKEACRIYINPEYCPYAPVIGQKIIAVQGRYGVDRIVVVG